jgi:peptidyl-prolyl cis-trans isomerase SurA
MASFTRIILATFVFGGLQISSIIQAQVGQPIIDGVAAIVNDKVITFSEVKKQNDPTERTLRETYAGQDLVNRVKESRLSTLKNLVERELIIQDFNKKQFFIPESIIEERLKEVVQTQFDGDRTAFTRTIQANGVSLEQYKGELKDNMIVGAMRGRNVTTAVIVSPFKIERYYQENIREFMQEEEVKLSIIYLRKGLFKEKRVNAKGVEELYDPAEAITQEILFKLDTGADFSELARSYSEGKNRDQGGDWGWTTKKDLREEIVKAAAGLQPGQISRLVVTDDGYYIVRLEDTRRSRVVSMNEVRNNIEATLIKQERLRLQQEWIDGLRSKAFIKMF